MVIRMMYLVKGWFVRYGKRRLGSSRKFKPWYFFRSCQARNL